MENPLLLDEIIEDYWRQDPLYILTVLVKRQTGVETVQDQNRLMDAFKKMAGSLKQMPSAVK